MTIQLSPNFNLDEMIRSQTATRKGLNNMPEDHQIESLSILCRKILEPVRAHYGVAISITSGYRGPALNKAVGGAKTSQHCFGEAADFHVHGVSDVEVAKWIEANLDFDQLILEFPPEGWVHCSYAPNPRGQVLTARRIGSTTKYIPGLHP